MKNLAILLVSMSFGSAIAQDSSLKKERYEHFENGELIEQDFSVEKDGVPQENYDFNNDEFFKEKSMDDMNADFDAKRLEMDNRMKGMQKKADHIMKSTMTDMNKRMDEMKQRTQKMQQDMKKRMDDSQRKMNNRQDSKELSPKPESEPSDVMQTFGA